MVFPAGHDPSQVLSFREAVSTLPDPLAAIDDVIHQLDGMIGIDMCIIFISAHHADEAAQIVDQLAARLHPKNWLGLTVDAVIAGMREYERTPGISVLASCLPGVSIKPFAVKSLEYSNLSLSQPDASLRSRCSITSDLRAMLLFADPFSVPMNRLLPALNASRCVDDESKPIGVLAGGLLSGAAKAHQNTLVANGTVLNQGFVGLSISGDITIDTVVSQGCRPIGPNMIITKAKNNVIYQLGNKPALDALKELLDSLGMNERKLLRKGLFVGRVVSEYKDHTGRGDYLIRNVAGVNPQSGIIAVQDLVRTGQTIRFHIRDAQSAHEDLALLLDAQKLYSRPDGILLISCTGRGRNLFARSNHDATTMLHAFDLEEPGEEQAKPGSVIDPSCPPIPQAGCFAAGEIGPVAEQAYLHGHSLCAVLFRSR